jgi:hypothetical protein
MKDEADELAVAIACVVLDVGAAFELVDDMGLKKGESDALEIRLIVVGFEDVPLVVYVEDAISRAVDNA